MLWITWRYQKNKRVQNFKKVKKKKGSILTVDPLAITVKQIISSSLLNTVVTLRTFTQIGIDVSDQVSLFISHPLDFLAHSTIGAVDITSWLHEKDNKVFV